jgi:hypothetical protein
MTGTLHYIVTFYTFVPLEIIKETINRLKSILQYLL